VLLAAGSMEGGAHTPRQPQCDEAGVAEHTVGVWYTTETEERRGEERRRGREV
jgi:hypothetical protein